MYCTNEIKSKLMTLTFSLFLDFTCTLTVMPALLDGDLMRVSGEHHLTFLENNFQFMLC